MWCHFLAISSAAIAKCGYLFDIVPRQASSLRQEIAPTSREKVNHKPVVLVNAYLPRVVSFQASLLAQQQQTAICVRGPIA